MTAAIHGAIHLVLLITAAVLSGHAHTSLLLAPLILLPVMLFTLGLAWIFAALGAYARDLAHGMPVLVQFLMFLSPVFYPLTAAPGWLRTLHRFNPVSMAMEDLRSVTLEGALPHWTPWVSMLGIGLVCAALGYVFFMRCKEDFADVL